MAEASTEHHLDDCQRERCIECDVNMQQYLRFLRARSRATETLVDRHYGEFYQLLEEELRES